MSNHYENLADSLRERKAAHRQEIFDRVMNLAEDLSRLENETSLVKDAMDGIIVSYVVERLSKRDVESVKIFKNMLPSKMHKKLDEAVEMFEYIHGKTPML